MKIKYISTSLRVIGTLSGIMGLATIIFAVTMLARHNTTAVALFIPIFTALIGIYELYFCYLTWRRLSPTVIQHFFGILGFFAISAVLKYIDLTPKASVEWKPFLFIALLLAIYYGYRALSSRMNRILFPES